MKREKMMRRRDNMVAKRKLRVRRVKFPQEDGQKTPLGCPNLERETLRLGFRSWEIE